MAERYRGRITSYEIWNEGSLKVFFGGTAKQLADLTIQGSRAIKSVDPGAKVLSAEQHLWRVHPAARSSGRSTRSG